MLLRISEALGVKNLCQSIQLFAVPTFLDNWRFAAPACRLVPRVALATLADEPLPGDYDTAHLQAVHREIPWLVRLKLL